MTTFHEIAARWAAWLWPALADHLWQATIFTLVVLVAVLLLGRSPARVRYALWLVAAAKFIVPAALFAIPFRLSGFDSHWLRGASNHATRETSVLDRITQPGSMLGFDREAHAAASAGEAAHSELFCALTIIWLGGCAALLAVWWRRRQAFMHVLQAGRSVEEGREFDALQRAQARLGSKAAPRLVLAAHDIEPGVWRVRRPVIVLPESIAGHLDEDELEALMLHELIHVERRDNLVGNLQMFVCALFWFHPLVWLIRQRLLGEREQACDEKVLEVCGAPNAYASSILKVVRFCFGWKVAGVSGVVNGSNLRRRIENIMANKKRKLTPAHRALIGALVLAVTLFSAAAGIYGEQGGARALAQDGVGGRVAVNAGGEASAGRSMAASQDVSQELEQAPEVAITSVNEPDAPIVINNVRMKVISHELYKRTMGKMMTVESDTDEYLTLPNATLYNTSGKRVTHVSIGFSRNDKMHVVLGHWIDIEPGATYHFTSGWREFNVRRAEGNAGQGELNAVIARGHGELLAKVVFVAFADGSEWGDYSSRPTHPKGAMAGGGSGGEASSNATLTGVARVSGAGSNRSSNASGTGGSGGARTVAPATATGGMGSNSSIEGAIINAPDPVYPPIAKAARAEGTVRVEVTVDEQGTVIAGHIFEGHPLLQSAALAAAKQAKFRPVVVEGKAVEAKLVLSYKFELPGRKKDEQ